ncbi:capsid protein [Chicken virus mg5_2876]|uniref:Capsid protein n=1 Tax=Chicken virus mg5_2876 TaxID=2720907 RepID=A0AAE6XNF0_9VIRU|nr:capsid protein [Chicken virus mg5_2876]QIR82204.1 capsid protein [Chicken virus mg5_2876]
MAYGRRSRRLYTRRNRRSLSNRYIYGKKGSSAQAKQIAALRNRVSAIAKSCRPETKVTYQEFGNVFNNSSTAANSWGNFIYLPKAQIDGNTIQWKSFRLCGNFEYSDTFGTNVAIDHQRTCTMRIIVYQLKSASNKTPGIDGILDVTPTGVGYELNAYKPFKAGAGRTVKILSNRVITLSDQQPIKRFDIKLNKGLINETYLLDNESDLQDVVELPTPRGAFGVSIVASGLHWDSTYSQQVRANFFVKTAFTDN